MPEKKQLHLDQFRFDDEIMTREVQESEPLELFREIYREEGPEALPPIIVYHDADGLYWVADGHYRITAAREALSTDGPRTLLAEVYKGSKRDAILYAAGANKHGQPLTPHEKRAVIQRLLKDPEWSQWSDRKIARHTGTSHVFVGGIRKVLELEAAASGSDYQIAPTTRTVQRGGTTYPMHTASIGHIHSVQAVPASTDNHTDDGMESVITEGFDGLVNAWRAATYEARRAFKEWVLKRPAKDFGPVIKSSEDAQRYSSEIAQACRTDDVA